MRSFVIETEIPLRNGSCAMNNVQCDKLILMFNETHNWNSVHFHSLKFRSLGEHRYVKLFPHYIRRKLHWSLVFYRWIVSSWLIDFTSDWNVHKYTHTRLTHNTTLSWTFTMKILFMFYGMLCFSRKMTKCLLKNFLVVAKSCWKEDYENEEWGLLKRWRRRRSDSSRDSGKGDWTDWTEEPRLKVDRGVHFFPLLTWIQFPDRS